LKTRILVLIAAMVGLLAPVSGAVAPANAAACSQPKYVTSDPNGMWGDGAYIVHNNMWNASGYRVSEKLRACSHQNWSVRAKANNSSGDGAVKTYPNVHRDYHNWNTGKEPKLAAFKSIRSTFASRTPRVGIYNAAYDIWLNGVPGNREVMIWTDNYRQVPAGSVVARNLSFSGHKWTLYATKDNGYLAFKPAHRITRGTLNLKAMLSYLTKKGRVPSGSTLGQICYGFEIVSTGGNRATFKVDKFSVSSSRR
jgi:hypothetical protein